MGRLCWSSVCLDLLHSNAATQGEKDKADTATLVYGVPSLAGHLDPKLVTVTCQYCILAPIRECTNNIIASFPGSPQHVKLRTVSDEKLGGGL